jgi:hypothetical protein
MGPNLAPELVAGSPSEDALPVLSPPEELAPLWRSRLCALYAFP